MTEEFHTNQHDAQRRNPRLQTMTQHRPVREHTGNPDAKEARKLKGTRDGTPPEASTSDGATAPTHDNTCIGVTEKLDKHKGTLECTRTAVPSSIQQDCIGDGRDKESCTAAQELEPKSTINEGPEDPGRHNRTVEETDTAATTNENPEDLERHKKHSRRNGPCSAINGAMVAHVEQVTGVKAQWSWVMEVGSLDNSLGQEGREMHGRVQRGRVLSQMVFLSRCVTLNQRENLNSPCRQCGLCILTTVHHYTMSVSLQLQGGCKRPLKKARHPASPQVTGPFFFAQLSIAFRTDLVHSACQKKNERCEAYAVLTAGQLGSFFFFFFDPLSPDDTTTKSWPAEATDSKRIRLKSDQFSSDQWPLGICKLLTMWWVPPYGNFRVANTRTDICNANRRVDQLSQHNHDNGLCNKSTAFPRSQSQYPRTMLNPS